MNYLDVTSGLQYQYTINLRPGENTIGRSSDNIIIFDHPKLSQKHAVITVEGGTAVLEDLNSMNGTQVNGYPVEDPILLQENDQVLFGTAVSAIFLSDISNRDGQDATELRIQSRAQSKSRTPKILGLLTLFGVGLIALAGVFWFVFGSQPASEEELSIEPTLLIQDADNGSPNSEQLTASAPLYLITPEKLREEVVFQNFEITNLFVASGESYEIIFNGFTSGAKAFIDRDYVIDNIPSRFEGLTYISTAVGDKFRTDEEFISFNTSVDVTIFISYDVRFSEKAEWLGIYGRLPEQIELGPSEGGTYDLYTAEYEAGKIVLGGNYQPDETGNYGMYLVIIAPSTIQATLELSSSGSGLQAITLGSSTGFIFSSSILSTADRDIWWNGGSLVPGERLISLGQMDNLNNVTAEGNIQNMKFDSFVPTIGEVFVIEIIRDGATTFAAIRIMDFEVSGDVTFEFIYPLE